MKSKVNIGNALAYAQGHLRYRAYHSRWLRWLLPGHVREQIRFRINSMDRECYARGSCVLCGCAVTALQMADRACDRPCYPQMLGRRAWRRWRSGERGIHRCTRTRTSWMLDRRGERFMRHAQTTGGTGI